MEAEEIAIRRGWGGASSGQAAEVGEGIGLEDAGGGKQSRKGGRLCGEECQVSAHDGRVNRDDDTTHDSRVVIFPADIVTSLRNVSPRG